MNAAPIHDDQTETRGAAWGLAVGCGCRRAPAFDHLKPTAVRFSSRALRNLGRGFGSVHFQGVRQRSRASVATINFHATQGRVQAFPEGFPRHFSNPFPKSSFRPDHHGRSENGWGYRIQVKRHLQ